jgi:competence protein ComEA
MLDFSAAQRKALIVMCCLLAVLLLTAGYLRLVRGSGPLHTLFIQPTPMQAPTAETSASGSAPVAKGLPRSSLPASVPAPVPATSTNPVNLNAASTAQLQSIPEIGPVLASRIVRYREIHGAFNRPEDLLKVQGIGRVTLERIRPFVTCGAQ